MVEAALSVKLTPGEIAVMRALFGMPAVFGPLMIMPTARLPVFTVDTVVVAFVEQAAMENGMPWTEFPTVNLLTSDAGVQVMVVVALSAQLVALLAAKFSASRVFQVVPPSGEIWNVHPLFENKSALRA